ncbi:ABC transporter substrate-binding protein/permease [Nocardioides lianchengensis]|uniref:Cystine transport system permease protein n=1 Tax=Nocardioides lianchengensis TaxID=1045774 RepID=A0A1G6LW39_9ACTN|nr:ABC transporter substrate-binding protein/permease [Nocardioides lianchengensis]NYG12425.1 cystine transport system permease protein [Nocardioides lianchengensis]SDC47518.1 cystine transport system permease protein [Nocardioides lianchengensis]
MSRPPSAVRLLLLLVATALLTAVGAVPVQAAGQDRAAADGERRVVRVGTEGTYPPFTFTDPETDELTGYDIEVMKAVGERAGWDLRFTQGTFDALFPALDAERIDVIANQVTINDEREARYLFTQPYTFSRGVIVTASDTDDITSLADLKGRTTAQSETSNWAQVARDAGADVQSVEGFGPAAELLVQGRVDAIVNDNIAVLDYLASTGSDEIKIAGDAGEEVSRQALVFRQGDEALRDEADAALRELAADGTLAEISEDYFGADVSVENDADLDVAGSDSGRSRWDVVRDAAWPMLRGALVGTIPLTVISFVAGLALALALALARLSGVRLLDWPARAYVSLIRGTPLLVQLFIVFYGLGQVGLKLPSFAAACLALSLNVAGYAAEVIRASILSVPRGQFEAATTIGMDSWQTMRRIVLPQASRIAVPPLGNTLLSLIKDTALASVVLAPELFRAAQDAAALSTEYLPLYCFAALYYWVICYLVSLAQQPLERRLGRYAV